MDLELNKNYCVVKDGKLNLISKYLIFRTENEKIALGKIIHARYDY